MASSVSKQIQAETESLIEARSKIWRKYDEAQEQVAELHKYSNKFGNINAPDVGSKDFDTNNLPPAGVAAAVWKLKQKDGEINALRQKIQSYEEDLKKNENQFLIVIVAAVVGALFILFLLFGMINS